MRRSASTSRLPRCTATEPDRSGGLADGRAGWIRLRAGRLRHAAELDADLALPDELEARVVRHRGMAELAALEGVDRGVAAIDDPIADLRGLVGPENPGQRQHVALHWHPQRPPVVGGPQGEQGSDHQEISMIAKRLDKICSDGREGAVRGWEGDYPPWRPPAPRKRCRPWARPRAARRGRILARVTAPHTPSPQPNRRRLPWPPRSSCLPSSPRRCSTSRGASSRPATRWSWRTRARRSSPPRSRTPRTTWASRGPS